jgi:hypothetical protein
MHHAITLPELEYKKLSDGIRHIVTKHSPVYAAGDTITCTLQGFREQMEFDITVVDTDNIHGKWCVLGLTTEVIPLT